jgi:hypothetical protein
LDSGVDGDWGAPSIAVPFREFDLPSGSGLRLLPDGAGMAFTVDGERPGEAFIVQSVCMDAFSRVPLNGGHREREEKRHEQDDEVTR